MDQFERSALHRAQAALNIISAPSRDSLARDYLRGVIARAVARSSSADPFEIAAKRWGASSRAALICKSGISATDRDDALTADHGRDEFFATVLEASIIGKLTQARRLGFGVRTITPSAGSTGYWLGESQAAPVSKLALTGAALPSRKVAGLVVTTKEALADPATEDRVIGDITRACVGVLDQAFVSDDSGDASTPAGILDNVSGTASVGDPANDFAQAIDDFAGDLSTSAWIMDPVTAAQAALHGGPVFQSLGVNGGSVLGIPAIVSRSSPRDTNGGQIVLLDQAGLAVAYEGIELALSTAASIEADNDPDADAEEPTAGTKTRINLFQNELVAHLLTIHANWRLVRPGAVTAITAAHYEVS